MADILKPIYGEVWANAGERLPPPDSKIESGWIQEMMPFQYENWIQHRQDNTLAYLLQKGISEWSGEQEYIANKSVVTYMSNLYMATSTSTNVNPTVSTSWKRLNSNASPDGVVSISGGGTGATTASVARTNLGVGTLGTQNSDSVEITGGTITSIIASGAFTGNLVGNASTATAIQTARTFAITGAALADPVSFNATANVLLNVLSLDATKLTGVATINTTGNAATATVLQTPRTITLSGAATANPTSFNGSGDISIPVISLNATDLLTGVVPVGRLGNAVTKTSATGSAQLPVGTTSQRDVSPVLGSVRINSSTNNLMEYWNGAAWITNTGSDLGGLIGPNPTQVSTNAMNDLKYQVANLDYPGIRPSPLLDFANAGSVDSRIQFTRNSIATCCGADGSLKTIGINTPRIDFDPATGRCLGLLVEEQRTNLLTYSSDFTNAAWVKGRLSVGAPYGQTYGALTGVKLVEDSGGVTGTHSLSRTVSAAAGVTVTQYWIVAAGERSSVALRCAAPAVVGRAFFDLTAGVYRTDNANVTAGMKRMMGSLWLIWATYAISAGGSSGTCQIELATTYAGGGIDYIGDGVSGAYVFGAQFEVGAFPTSYIPTTTAQVTRAADAAYIDLGDTLPSAGFSVLIEGESSWGGDYPVIFSDEQTALGNFIGLRMASAGAYVNSTEGTRSATLLSRPAASIPFRAAVAFSNIPLENRVAINGQLSDDRTIALAPINYTLRRYMKLATTAFSAQGQWRIRRVAVYPVKMTGAQLQNITK